MKRPFMVLSVVFVAALARGQSLTVADKLVLTVTKVERVKERQVQTQFGPQTEGAGKGREFVQLHFAPGWVPGHSGNPCDETVIHRAGDYEFVGGAGSKVLGMQGSYSIGEAACKTFTMLFQPSPAGESFTRLRWKGKEADISKVPGAKGPAVPK